MAPSSLRVVIASVKVDVHVRALHPEVVEHAARSAFVLRLVAVLPEHLLAARVHDWFLLKVSFFVISFAPDKAFIQQLGLF